MGRGLWTSRNQQSNLLIQHHFSGAFRSPVSSFLLLAILLARYNPPAVARSARPPYTTARPLELSVQREYSVPVSQAMKAIAKFWSLHSRPNASIALYSGCSPTHSVIQ